MSTEQTAGALTGAAKGAVIGSVVPVIGTALGAVAGGIIGFFSAPKKPKYTPVDVNKLMSDARTQYATNFQNSTAMERSVNPGLNSMDAVANQTSAGFKARNSFLADLQTGNGDLLNTAAASARQQQLLGGKLDPETQNAVMRGALSNGAGAGISGSGAGRGLAARDLGLTSMSLLQNRQDRASQMGSLLQQLGLSKFNAGESAAQMDTSAAVGLGSAYNSIFSRLPSSGLDPTDVANVTIGNNKGNNDYNLIGTLMDNQARADAGSAAFSLMGGVAGGVTGGGNTGQPVGFDWSKMFAAKPK